MRMIFFSGWALIALHIWLKCQEFEKRVRWALYGDNKINTYQLMFVGEKCKGVNEEGYVACNITIHDYRDI